MIRRILKKDMKRRKSINFILFLFITIASVFLSSSINNILVITQAIDYYLDYANIPDINVIIGGTNEAENEKLEQWIDDEAPGVTNYEQHTLLDVQEKEVFTKKDGKQKAFRNLESNLYLSTPNADYCKVFDKEGKTFTLKEGEMAVPIMFMDENKLSVGDSIVVRAGAVQKEFTVKLAIKDGAYGSEMLGMSRLIVSDDDYQFFNEQTEQPLTRMYYVDTDEKEAFIQELNNLELTTLMTTLNRDTYSLVYSFDMIMAALLILIGICLILIALLVLRFTLVFTIEEDYKEIGIMKAVGIKNFAIKKLYLLKYFVIVSAGSVLGLAASIPVSREMVKSVSKNMIMEDSSANIGINILCTIFIILLVLLFCYRCTKKLNKISAIAAIRGGRSGERFKRKAGIRLHTRKRMPVTVFLGLNDIFNNLRRYLVLMITFCISFVLITIPLNTVNTMQSKEMIERFAVDPDSAAFLSDIEQSGESYKNSKQLSKRLSKLEEEFAQKGYDTRLTAGCIYFFSYEGIDGNTKTNYLTMKLLGPNDEFLTYQEGEAPELENEIAFSEKVMETNDWEIGDYVETTINGSKQKLLITATYSDYMQMGESARLNPEIDCSEALLFGYWTVMVDMDTELTQKEAVAELKKEFPAYKWSTGQELADSKIGGIQQTLKDIIIPMTAMLCAIIMLITYLMESLFIVREKGEVAMMKSIGYRVRDIRWWQVLRMVWIALVSMVLAIPLTMINNWLTLKPIFAIMGANVNIQVVPWQVYGLYPAILLVGIIVATAVATRKVKKVNIQELNNLE